MRFKVRIRSFVNCYYLHGVTSFKGINWCSVVLGSILKFQGKLSPFSIIMFFQIKFFKEVVFTYIVLWNIFTFLSKLFFKYAKDDTGPWLNFITELSSITFNIASSISIWSSYTRPIYVVCVLGNLNSRGHLFPLYLARL